MLMTHTGALAFIIASVLQPATSDVAVPPGARRVVAADKLASRTAVCAEVPPEEAKLMQRNGRRLPATHIFIDDGRTVRKVVTGLGGCDPAWSPDGNWLAFTAPDGLWVIAPESDTGRRLVDTTQQHSTRYTTMSHPRWSPDSGRIAYLLRDRRTIRIQVVDAMSGQVLLTSGAKSGQFSWTDASTLSVAGETVSVP